MNTKTVQRPEDKMPRSDQECPLCKAPPLVAHKDNCPWRLWAEAGRPS